MTIPKKFYFIAAISVAAAVLIIAAWTSNRGQADAEKNVVVPVAVEVTPAAASTITEIVSAVGTVEAVRDVQVSSETSGRITRVPIRVGDFVRAGQTLVQVDDELKAIAVDQAKAQLLAAETSLQKAKSDLSRAETLRASGDIADVELEGNRLALHAAEAQQKGAAVALRFAQRQLEDTRIKAPVAGLVASKKVEVGEMVGPGQGVANIVDVRQLKVKLCVPEEEIWKVKAGQKSDVRTDVAPGMVFNGTVQSVGSKTESPTGHTYPVEILISRKPEDALKVGMFAKVAIHARSSSDGVVVSKESLTGDAARPAVFVAEKGLARLRNVRVGIRSASECQIVEGLAPGELVISFGHTALKDGSAVQYK